MTLPGTHRIARAPTVLKRGCVTGAGLQIRGSVGSESERATLTVAIPVKATERLTRGFRLRWPAKPVCPPSLGCRTGMDYP